MHASVHISSYPSMYACVCPPVYPSMHSSIHPCVHPSIQKYLSIFCSAPDTIVGESESHSVVSDSLQSHALYSPWNSLGQNTGVSSFSLLQGIFPARKLNSGLLHCRRILYQLSHKGSQVLELLRLKYLTLLHISDVCRTAK